MLYSPRIPQHTRKLYRLAQLLKKPMTRVADDLIKHGLANLETVYDRELAERWNQAVVAEDPPPQSE